MAKNIHPCGLSLKQVDVSKFQFAPGGDFRVSSLACCEEVGDTGPGNSLVVLCLTLWAFTAEAQIQSLGTEIPQAPRLDRKKQKP